MKLLFPFLMSLFPLASVVQSQTAVAPAAVRSAIA